MIDPSPIAPVWFTAPLGVGGLLVIGSHLIALQHSAMEPRRRRLRTATTILLMLATPLIVYAASVARPTDPRTFVLSWVLVAALMTMVLVLALVDIAHTAAIHRAELRELRRRLAESRAKELAALASGGRDDPPR
jgi:peptidoglycan/LPS O-acetylase OafA/YrhL